VKRPTLDDLRAKEDELAARLCRLAARLDEVRRRRRRAEARLEKASLAESYSPEILSAACTTCDVGPGRSCEPRKCAPHALESGEPRKCVPHAARLRAVR
jgi:hypothetical protein